MPIIKANSSAPAKHAIALDLGDLAQQGQLLIQQAQRRADQILAEAKAERARLVESAAADGRAEGLAQGLADGHRQGMTAGHAAALAESRDRLTQLEASMLTVAAEWSARREDLLAQSERHFLRLAVALAERIVKRTIAADPSVVASQVETVLKLALRPSRLTLRINPADRRIIEQGLPRFAEVLPAGAHLELQDDPTIAPGGCALRLADGTGGTLDGTIEGQLDRLAESIVPIAANRERPVLAADGAATDSAGHHPANPDHTGEGSHPA